MIDQIMFLFGNITGTSRDLRASIRANFDLTNLIIGIMSLSTLPKIFIKNYVWVASNLAMDAAELDLECIRNLVKIFGDFLEVFKNHEDELAMSDCVKGLSKIVEVSNPTIIKVAVSKPGLI
jgi:hypothetical protein